MTRAAGDLTPEQKQEMRQLYDRATRAYDVGKYAEAIEFYQKAYEIGGDPPMLYNIAQSYRLNDQPADAVRFYRRYLQRAPNARNKDDVERKITELEKVVEDRRKTQSTPPPVVAPVIPVAPAPATTTPAPVAPAPIEGPANPAATPPVEATPAQASAEPSEGSRVRRIVGYSCLGVAVAAGVGALVEGLIAKSDANKVTSASQSNGKTAFDPTWESNGKNANTTMIGLAIGAGAAAVAGVILVATSMSGSQDAASEPATTPASSAMVSPWIGGGVVGAGAALRF
ncbi:MAG TPA: tetratricopeptide repeat protein [Polyangia bacterium]|nr:tetratricopeptide repeat protein [Polyangia bacterium]